MNDIFEAVKNDDLNAFQIVPPALPSPARGEGGVCAYSFARQRRVFLRWVNESLCIYSIVR